MRFILLVILAVLCCGCAAPTLPNQTQNSAQQINMNRRRHYIATHSNLPEEIKQNILNGVIQIGMTKEMVRAALGAPDDFQRSGDASGIREVWVYYSPLAEPDPNSLVGLSPADIALVYSIAHSRRKATYLLFVDGVFTSFREQ
jgi:hypothetical protein